MKFLNILLITLLVLMTSCTATKHDNTHGEVLEIAPKITMAFTTNMNGREKNLLIEAAQKQIAAIEEDLGARLKAVKIYLFRGESIPCGKLPGRFTGCHFNPSGPIYVIIGDDYEIPSLYHEFVHHMIPGNDSKHKDPRWNSTWRPKQQQLVDEITSSR